jgi:VWFA-related protein
LAVQLVTLARVSPRRKAATFAQQSVPAPSSKPTPQATPATATKEDDDVVRITTNLVQVDAVIVDKSGKPVTDLKPEEVQILEDGRPQKITHFSYVLNEATPTASSQNPGATVRSQALFGTPGPVGPPAALRPEEVHRTIALVVDDLGLSFQSIYFVRRALQKFVDEQMQPGDLVAIVRTSGGIGALQQFTADKRQLHAAIDHVKFYYGGRSSAYAPLVPPTPSAHGASGGSVNAGSVEQTTLGATGAAMDAAEAELNQFREDVYAVGTLGAVNYVVKGLVALPGRKSILLISDGFRIFNRDDPTRNDRAGRQLQLLIDQANRASVVVYTMNATGLATRAITAEDSVAANGPLGIRTDDQMLSVLGDRRAAAFETQEGMDVLASETGGIAIHNTNDLAGGIKKVLNDQNGYYLIGYRPEQSTFDRKTGRRTFHKLSLKVTRTGTFNVRMRNGFFGVADEEVKAIASTPREQVLGALFSPFGAAGVHTQLTSLFANDAKLGSFMRSILYVNARDLTFTDEPDDWHKATFDVVAVTFGEDGSAADELSRTHELRVRGETYQNILKDGFVYFVSVPIKKPGAYQLRTVLRDHDSERVGSANQFVEIPDLKKGHLALSGIVGGGIDPTTLTKQANLSANSNSSAENRSQEGTELTDPQASEAVRRFRAGMLVNYAFFIYNARVSQDTGQPQLQVQARLFRNGQPVFTGPVRPFALNRPPDLSRLRAESSLRLGADMVPGEYILQVVVSDSLADEKHRTATQWMDFEIVK